MKPILIIGAGPVGLVCAAALVDSQIPFRLFEAEAGIPDDFRASTFHPPTLDLLDGLGLGRTLLRFGVETPRWQIRLAETGERAEFDLGVLEGDTNHPFRLQCEQQNLQRLLTERLGGRVEYGSRVEDVGADAAGVSVVVSGRRIEGSWLIGADGAHSVVRRAFGIGFEGETYPETSILVTTDFDFASALDGLSGVNYVWSSGGTYSLLRLRDVWRCAYPLERGESADEALSDTAIEQRLQEIAPRSKRYRILERRAYRVHRRVAATFRRGRVLLAGDAAHLNSPKGGMGMNSGIHDAFNLVEKLAAVRAGAPADLLDRYDRQRRAIATKHVLGQSDANRSRMQERDASRRRDMLAELQAKAADPARARQYLLDASMISGLREAADIA